MKAMDRRHSRKIHTGVQMWVCMHAHTILLGLRGSQTPRKPSWSLRKPMNPRLIFSVLIPITFIVVNKHTSNNNKKYVKLRS